MMTGTGLILTWAARARARRARALAPVVVPVVQGALLAAVLLTTPLPLQAGQVDQQALIRAIQQNDLAAARDAVEAGADPHLPGDGGVTGAQLAVRLGHLNVAQYLLSQRPSAAATAPAARPSAPLVGELDGPEVRAALADREPARAPSATAEDALAALDQALAGENGTPPDDATPIPEPPAVEPEDDTGFLPPDLFEDNIPPAAVPEGQTTLAEAEAELDQAGISGDATLDEDGYPIETTEQRLARLDRLLAEEDIRDPSTILEESRALARARPDAGLGVGRARGGVPAADSGLAPTEKAVLNRDAIPDPDTSIVDRPLPRTPAEAMPRPAAPTPGELRRAARQRGQATASAIPSGPPLPAPDPAGNAGPIRDPWFRPGSPGIPERTAEVPPKPQPDAPQVQQTARLAPPPPEGETRPPSADIPRPDPRSAPPGPDPREAEPVILPERGTPAGGSTATPGTTAPAPTTPTGTSGDPDLDLLFAEPDPASSPLDLPAPDVGETLADPSPEASPALAGAPPPPDLDPDPAGPAAPTGDPDLDSLFADTPEPTAPDGDADLDSLFADTEPVPAADLEPASSPAPAAPDGDADLDSLFADTEPAPAAPDGDADLDSLFADSDPAPAGTDAADASSEPAEDGELDLDQLFGDLTGETANTEPEGPPLPEIQPVRLRLDAEGLPILPKLWTLPVVIPGTLPPDGDMARAVRRSIIGAGSIDPLAPLEDPGPVQDAPWPVTLVELEGGDRIQLAPSAPEPGSGIPEATGAPIARDITLTLGINASLFNVFAPTSDDPRQPPENCVSKARGQTLFCVKGLSWPSGLEPNFLVSTILYTGAGAVVRFDKGEPTRMQSVYSSEGFTDIADWLIQRFGAPSETVERSVAPFGQPRQDNPTLRWTSADKLTGEISVLEIRQFDDTRGGFPDLATGVIMLYRDGAPSIFPQVSIHELMRLNRTG